MPLFGHKNKDTAATHEAATPHTSAGAGHRNADAVAVAPINDPYNQQYNPNPATGGLGGTGPHEMTGPVTTGQSQGRHAPVNNMQGQRHTNDGYSGPGQATGVGANNDALPTTGTLNDRNQSRSGQAFTGKVERAVGSLIGSAALKAKGLQKEQEANSIKFQGSELAEAERLEREALMRRERAVGHGAHPDNKHLGAGFTSGGAGGAGGY